MHIGVGVRIHIPMYMYNDWLVVSLINQVGSTYASIMFSVSFLLLDDS